MYKYITSFFRFLVPIVRKSVVQVAADTLTNIAYPERPRHRSYSAMADYARRDVRHTQDLFKPRTGPNPFTTARAKDAEPGFHDVLMVAFDLSGPNAKNVHEWLHDQLPKGDAEYGDAGEIFLDSWWVANDERFDRSDCDSAVFVQMGKQAEARALLREHGLLL